MDYSDPEGFLDAEPQRRGKPVIMRWQPSIGAASKANESRAKVWYVVMSMFWLPILGLLALTGAAQEMAR